MTSEEVRALGVLLFTEIVMWIPSCLGHYVGRGARGTQECINAPGWLRKVFGDFRKSGSLVIQYMAIQVMVYVAVLTALLIVMVSDLTRQIAFSLWLAQFALTAVAVGVGRVIASCLRR